MSRSRVFEILSPLLGLPLFTLFCYFFFSWAFADDPELLHVFLVCTGIAVFLVSAGFIWLGVSATRPIQATDLLPPIPPIQPVEPTTSSPVEWRRDATSPKVYLALLLLFGGMLWALYLLPSKMRMYVTKPGSTDANGNWICFGDSVLRDGMCHSLYPTDAMSDGGRMLGMLLYAGLAALLYYAFVNGRWYAKWRQGDAEAKVENMLVEGRAEHQTLMDKRKAEWEARPPPSRAELERSLNAAFTSIVWPRKSELVAIVAQGYPSGSLNYVTHTPDEALAFYKLYLDAAIEGLSAYFDGLASTDISSPFVAHRFPEQEEVAERLRALARPFKEIYHQHEKYRNLFGSMLPELPPRIRWRDYEGKTEKEYDRDLKQWDKQCDKIIDALPPFERALMGTPMYPYAQQFEITETKSTFTFPEDARFFGQWIIGEPGAGKTTFISTMIEEDLQKVARNEASVFVMDSQNELIPDIAKLELFAPGRPLHGKLIYLEPNPDYPLGLNIFDINKSRQSSLSSSEERMMLQNGVEWMVDFFLSSLVKSDETSRQGTFLTYLIPAILAIPDATVFTLQDLLEPARTKGGETGYDRYKQHFGGLRENTQKWLRERMHSIELAVTRNGIRDRLEGFVARDLFHDMFKHPHNKLDLFQELQSGKVILVNTKGALLKKNLEPFGRYFIARLLQAAEERMFTERGNRLPVYAYIDEAHDYIAEEENIEELKNKARKQKVALIIANQMESQITMPLVREALGRMAIQCRGEPPVAKDEAPVWHVSLGKQEPVRVSFPDTQFSKMPKMSEGDYQAMLQKMRERFSTRSGHTPSAQSTDTPVSEEPTRSLSEADLDYYPEWILEAQGVPRDRTSAAPKPPPKTPPKSDLDFG
jgi:hypothetical protein